MGAAADKLDVEAAASPSVVEEALQLRGFDRLVQLWANVAQNHSLCRQDKPARVACICADGDERYLDEIQSRYIPSVGQAAYEAALQCLAPVMASIQCLGPVNADAKAAAH